MSRRFRVRILGATVLAAASGGIVPAAAVDGLVPPSQLVCHRHEPGELQYAISQSPTVAVYANPTAPQPYVGVCTGVQDGTQPHDYQVRLMPGGPFLFGDLEGHSVYRGIYVQVPTTVVGPLVIGEEIRGALTASQYSVAIAMYDRTDWGHRAEALYVSRSPDGRLRLGYVAQPGCGDDYYYELDLTDPGPPARVESDPCSQ